MKKIILSILVSTMTLQPIMSPINKVISDYSNRIVLDEAYGKYYNKEVNTNLAGEETIISQDKDFIVKSPTVDTTISKYDEDSEVVEDRTENSKTYDIGNGYYVQEVYFEPVHKEEDGEYVEIDNTLVQQNSFLRNGSSVIENEDGLYDIALIGNQLNITSANQNRISITQENGNFENYEMKDNVILYSHVFENIDFEYHFTGDKIYSNYYINSNVEQTEFSFIINYPELNIVEGDEYLDFIDNDGNSIFKFINPIMTDENGQFYYPSVSIEYVEEETIRIIYHLRQEWMNDASRIYPMVMSTRVADGSTTLNVDSSYIRSAQPSVTSRYFDLFVGYDNEWYGGLGNLMGITRTFIHLSKPDIGVNKLIVSAELELYKEQSHSRQWNTLQAYKTSSYVNPASVNWSNQPTEANKTLVSTTDIRSTIGWQSFDVTSYMQDIYEGKNNTLVLQASNESSYYYAANIFNSEADAGHLPSITIVYRDDYDVNPDLAISSMDMELRRYGILDEGFYALSFDGIAKPDSNVQFDLYEYTNETDSTYIKTINATDLANKYFIDPIFVTNYIQNTQVYQKDDVNYTTNYIYEADLPKYDTLYEFKMKVTKGSETSQIYSSDKFIVYEVKLGDTLRSIASYYGLEVDVIKQDNNLSTNQIQEGQKLLLTYKADNPKVSKDTYTPPSKTVTYEAEYVYRGPYCSYACYAGDPINIANGNYYHESTDFTLNDYSELSLIRYYNSTGPQI